MDKERRWKKRKEEGKENKEKEKIKIGKGNLDILQPQSNRWSRFAKRFPKRLPLHQKSRSTRGARAGAVFGWAGALPNRPIDCCSRGLLYFIFFLSYEVFAVATHFGCWHSIKEPTIWLWHKPPVEVVACSCFRQTLYTKLISKIQNFSTKCQIY
jgi:hypothetical protein